MTDDKKFDLENLTKEQTLALVQKGFKLHNYGNLPIVLEMIGETVDVLTNKKKEFHLRTSVLNWSTHPHWQDKEGVDAFRKLFEHIDENVEREVEPIEDCLDDDGNDYNWYWR